MDIPKLDSHTVARALLGSRICRVIGGKNVCLTVSEVEVYDGFDDLASHASKGKTDRTKIMFGPAGFWYVYLVYGMHEMLNLVTREAGYPAALLIRAGVTPEGKHINGPGNVTKYLSVDRTFYGMSSKKGNELFIDWRKGELKGKVETTPRIGINYAGDEWKNKKWRYVVEIPKPKEKSLEVVLKEGGIAVIPTDTLYGIVGIALSKKTVERIYDVKGRDEHKPFIILISSLNDLKKFDIGITSKEKKLLDAFWPGPVSVILPCTSKKFEYLHRGSKSLAFRLPDDATLRALIKKTGPLVAPSANPQGEPPAETSKQAEAYFGDRIDRYVSGPKKKGKPSTVISFLNEKPEIVRQGVKKIRLDL